MWTPSGKRASVSRTNSMRSPDLQPTQQRLNELFAYDAPTGNLVARKKLPHRPIGKIIGSRNTAGYLCVEVDHYNERLHRLIWIMHYGPIPPGKYIDHINRVKTDNHIENLPLVTPRENARNSPIHKRSTSGATGVYADKKGRWMIRLSVWLGNFPDRDTAVAARRIARHKLDQIIDQGLLQ